MNNSKIKICGIKKIETLKCCIKNNINIYPIPGSSAVAASFSVSGFSEKYYFYGFFPEKNKDLKEDLKILSNLNCSIVFLVIFSLVFHDPQIQSKYFFLYQE